MKASPLLELLEFTSCSLVIADMKSLKPDFKQPFNHSLGPNQNNTIKTQLSNLVNNIDLTGSNIENNLAIIVSTVHLTLHTMRDN